ncbi:hypothetical protein JCM10207_000845 [Rhodosporidiobolus poonsookiae]
MSCTCLALRTALRTASPSLARPVAASSRPFSSSRFGLAAAPASPAAAKSASSRAPASSCPEGTTLSHLNYLKDGSDPVAQADSAYPAWLWALASGEEAAAAGKKAVAGEKEGEARIRAEKRELKRGRKVAIKAANDLKG